MDRSSRPPNAPPTPASVSRTLSAGMPSATEICPWSACSHCVATNRSTPPSSAGTASPDSGPRNAWSCIADLVVAGDHDIGGEAGTAPDAARAAPRCPPACSAGPVRGRCRASVSGAQYLVVDGDPAHRPAGGLRVVGADQRDRLTLVAHHVLGQHRLVGPAQAVPVRARHVGRASAPRTRRAPSAPR